MCIIECILPKLIRFCQGITTTITIMRTLVQLPVRSLSCSDYFDGRLSANSWKYLGT